MGNSDGTNQFDLEVHNVKGIWAVVGSRNMIFSGENIANLYRMLNPTFNDFTSIEQFCGDRDYPEEIDTEELNELLEVVGNFPAKLKNALIILQMIGAKTQEPVEDRPQQVPVVFLTFYGTSPEEEIIVSKDIPINFKGNSSPLGWIKRLLNR